MGRHWEVKPVVIDDDGQDASMGVQWGDSDQWVILPSGVPVGFDQWVANG